MIFIVDAHLDLAYNAVNYGRDIRRPLAEIRQAEGGLTPRGTATVAIPELQKAGAGVVFSTLFVPPAESAIGVFTGEIGYRNAAEAHKLGMAQLDYYHRLADEVEAVRLVQELKDLDDVVASHEAGNSPLLGLVLLLEGADPIREPEAAEEWYERGLRLIGLAWDDTRYSAGAWRGGDRGLTKEGYRLLEVMAELGFILDLTHMSEKATYEALDRYEGPVVSTHSNTRALIPGERQFSDSQIRRLSERGGVIGIVLYNSFLRAGHSKGDPKQLVTLDHVMAHIDHICQVLGDAAHVGLGSDLDGGFGAENIPAEMDSVADFPLIAARLRAFGYEEKDVVNIMGGNWLNLLRRALA
jgi:membrane dipeptidase